MAGGAVHVGMALVVEVVEQPGDRVELLVLAEALGRTRAWPPRRRACACAASRTRSTRTRAPRPRREWGRRRPCRQGIRGRGPKPELNGLRYPSQAAWTAACLGSAHGEVHHRRRHAPLGHRRSRREQERRSAGAGRLRPDRPGGRAPQRAAHPRRGGDDRAARAPRRARPSGARRTWCRCAPTRSRAPPWTPSCAERIRASFLLAGPLLARFGRADMPPPGGDVIGRRRLDPHFDAFRALGADVRRGRAPSSCPRPTGCTPATSSWTSRR